MINRFFIAEIFLERLFNLFFLEKNKHRFYNPCNTVFLLQREREREREREKEKEREREMVIIPHGKINYVLSILKNVNFV